MSCRMSFRLLGLLCDQRNCSGPYELSKGSNKGMHKSDSSDCNMRESDAIDEHPYQLGNSQSECRPR